MKTLDITVLAHEGPIYRAYMSIFNALGYKVKRIIKLYNGHNKLRWLPRYWRNNLLYIKEALSNNYWPIYFIKRKEIFEPIQQTILQNYHLPNTFFNLFSQSNFNTNVFGEECIYCDCESSGFKSDNLFYLLKRLGPQTYLFTGGGLVPQHVLALPQTQFVHVHPGFLPYVRGADGILWSTLIRQKPGAACFYMVPQLDEGQLILTEELPALRFNIPQAYQDVKTLYRLTFSFYDPAVRAVLLKRILEQFGILTNLPTYPQNITQGVTYHFMHDMLQRKVLKQIFM
ncbi:MAG: hypothetical protein LBJ78_04160 [Puniceicoccales bacterium]|nr:hypothetical protein [Puniceicoccales bacterium]